MAVEKERDSIFGVVDGVKEKEVAVIGIRCGRAGIPWGTYGGKESGMWCRLS